MTIREWVDETFNSEKGEEVMTADNFDDALIGVARDLRVSKNVAIYDWAKCIECLVKLGMNEEEAEEFFDFNTAQAYVGEGTPLFMMTPPPWYEGAELVDEVEIAEQQKEQANAVRSRTSRIPGRKAVRTRKDNSASRKRGQRTPTVARKVARGPSRKL